MLCTPSLSLHPLHLLSLFILPLSRAPLPGVLHLAFRPRRSHRRAPRMHDRQPHLRRVEHHRVLFLRLGLRAGPGSVFGLPVSVSVSARDEAGRTVLLDRLAVLPEERERRDEEDDGAEPDEEDGGADVLVGSGLVAELHASDGVDREQQPEEERRRLPTPHARGWCQERF
eukprot:2661634-Rhodomonas_salina.1